MRQVRLHMHPESGWSPEAFSGDIIYEQSLKNSEKQTIKLRKSLIN